MIVVTLIASIDSPVSTGTPLSYQSNWLSDRLIFGLPPFHARDRYHVVAMRLVGFGIVDYVVKTGLFDGVDRNLLKPLIDVLCEPYDAFDLTRGVVDDDRHAHIGRDCPVSKRSRRYCRGRGPDRSDRVPPDLACWRPSR